MLVLQPRAVLKITHSQPTAVGSAIGEPHIPNTKNQHLVIFSPTPVSVYQHPQHHLILSHTIFILSLINYPERPAYGPQSCSGNSPTTPKQKPRNLARGSPHPICNCRRPSDGPAVRYGTGGYCNGGSAARLLLVPIVKRLEEALDWVGLDWGPARLG
jgi:hypothetical protein